MKKLSTLHSQISTQQGFTLVEMLAVISIFVAVGTVIMSILFVSLRGTRKSDAIVAVKQSGDFALSQMVKNIRYAKSLDAPLSCVPSTIAQSVTVTSISDGGQTTYTCPATPTGSISSNSAALVDTNLVTVSACSFVCTQQSDVDPPTINIQFTLTAKNTGNLTEASAIIPFQTSVTMRNLGNR